MFVSCSKDDTNKFEEQDSYEISLALGGEMVDVSEIPLAKSEEAKKYYGINVLCMKTDGSESEYAPYACGVFDNIADMKISLLDGYKYKFECTSLIEREDRLYIRSSTNSFIQQSPFSEYSLEYLNKFISNYVNLPLTIMPLMVQGTVSRYYPKMDRYYGILEEYVPSKNGKAIIPMKRTAFGLEVKISEDIPDGELSFDIKIEKVNDSYYKEHHSSNDNLSSSGEKKEMAYIFTLRDIVACWENSDYSVECCVDFTWKRESGYEQKFSKEFIAKRNVMTVMNLTLNGGSSEQGIGTSEEGDGGTETIDVTFDGGSGNDTTVNPEE